MAVIKDNAYGIGSKIMLKILKESNVKWIVYNKYQEYIVDSLYNQAFNILILEGISRINSPSYSNNLYYSVNSIYDVNVIKNIKTKVNIHIQIDSGMNREGINNKAEFINVMKILKNNKNINIDGIYTHFSSEDSDFIFYDKELCKFKEYLKDYSFNNIHTVATPSLNKEIIGNMVRIGLALYGYGNRYITLKPSISYTCNLIKKYKVLKGEYIGYNKKYKAEEDLVVGLVDIGYSDICDILYLSSNNTRYYTIGSSCMNHMFIKLDNEINNLTRLNVLSKNDIISINNNNWYHILMSIRSVPKNYIRRDNYDISIVYQRTSKTYQEYRVRRRSNKTIST